MPDLDQLAARVREHIPLTRHLQFSLQGFAEGRLLLSAPLDANINDKGTMFAGSQAALMALAGWCLTTLEAEQRVGRSDVLAMHNSLRYLRPVTGDVLIEVTCSPESLARFRQRLDRGERAVLAIEAEARNADGEVASRYQAEYLARAL
ncbi:MAG: YiiD C-terminal domain-containing protein [Alcanivoracaceae bacterium]